MIQPLTVNHDDPQASILLGTNATPAREGQTKGGADSDRPLPKGSHSLSTLSAPQGHQPLEAWTVADAARSAVAILQRREQDCQAARLLPAGYHGEDCDRDEFFFPAAVLKLAVQDPYWGFLDDPHEFGTVEEHIARSIASTVVEMHRGFDHQQALSARLRMRLLAACRTELRLLLKELVESQVAS